MNQMDTLTTGPATDHPEHFQTGQLAAHLAIASSPSLAIDVDALTNPSVLAALIAGILSIFRRVPKA